MKSRMTKNAEPSLRGKLSEHFLSALQADFEINGAEVIAQLRLKSLEKYAEICRKAHCCDGTIGKEGSRTQLHVGYWARFIDTGWLQ
jgi:hypothetical protein